MFLCESNSHFDSALSLAPRERLRSWLRARCVIGRMKPSPFPGSDELWGQAAFDRFLPNRDRFLCESNSYFDSALSLAPRERLRSWLRARCGDRQNEAISI